MPRTPPRRIPCLAWDPAFLVLVALSAACTAKPADSGDTSAPDDSADTSDSDTYDTVESAYGDVTVTVSDVVTTVVHVTWTTDEPTTGIVSFERVDGAKPAVRVAGTTPSGGADTTHEALLFGLAPDTDYRLKVGNDTSGNDQYDINTYPFTTGSLPGDLPDLNPTIVDDAAGDGFMAVGMVSTHSYAGIFDHDGNYVWWFANPDGTNITTRVARSVDGRSVLLTSSPNAGTGDDGFYAIYRVSYDGTSVETIDTPALHHDFVELPDGTIAWLSYDVRTVDGDAVHGDTLMETSPDGVTRTVWDCWDWYDYADVPVNETAGTEFLHANTLHYDAASDQYWLGMRNISQIVKIDRSTGTLLEKIGGPDSTYTLTTGTPTSGQHSFSILPDGFVVLDNREDNDEDTRVVQFALDDTAHTMAETWSYTSPDHYHEFGLGDAIRLDNGNTRIVWSSSGELNEVTPAGDLLWKMNLDAGTGFGYGQYSVDPQVYP